MMSLTPHQMRAFGETARLTFEAQAIAHLRAQFPAQTVRLTDEQLSAFVQKGTARAAGFGIDVETDVLRYLEYTVMFGAYFEDQAEFAWAGRILKAPGLTGTAKLDRIDRLDMIRHT